MAAGPVFMRGKGRHLDIRAAHAAIRLRFAVGREVLRSIEMPDYFSVTTWACIANKGKCFCLAHYEGTIAKDTVNSQ